MKKKGIKSPWRADLKITFGAKCESVARFNTYLEPGWFSLVIVTKGLLEFRTEGIGTTVGPSEIYRIPRSAVLSGCSRQSKYSLMSCRFELVLKSRIAKFSLGYLEAMTASGFIPMKLSRVDLRQLLRLVAILREKVYRPIHMEFESEIFILCLNLLFYEYSAICMRNTPRGLHFHSRPEEITISFARLLEDHVRTHHNVKFYAERLCISPAYLRGCIRQVAGMPARHFIDTGLLSEAYVLLSDESLSIYDVSELLHFSSCSAFSTFFSKYAGLTPSKYRSNLR